jgi:hypothetical protein
MEVNDQLHATATLPLGKEPPNPIGWVGCRGDPDAVEKRKFYTSRNELSSSAHSSTY